MSEGQIFEEPKKGLFARLFGGRPAITRVRRKEEFSLEVPAGKEELARAAIERWLRSHDVGAAVTSEQAPNGKARIQAKLGGPDAAKLDFSTDDVQAELQDVLLDALRGADSGRADRA